MTPAKGVKEDAPEAVPPYSWYALGVLFLVYLVNFVDRQILSILANDIKADLGIGDAQLGFLYGTAFAIFYGLFGIPLGRLADGWHRLRLLSMGLALWSAMTMLSGFARNFAMLTAARIGVGVGEASANPCAYSLIADWFPKRLRATALSIYASGLFVGSGLSLVLGGAIVERWNNIWPGGGPLGLAGWQAAFVIVGFPGLVLALWVLTLKEPVRGVFEGEANANQINAWSTFFSEVVLILPPFTLIGAARRGARAFAVNVAAACLFTILAVAAIRIMGNPAQFILIGIGFYATFTWATALRARDPETFQLTWGSAAFMGVVLVYACVSYVGYTVTYWAAPYAERTFALSKTDLGWVIGAPNALGGFLGVLLGGWLADRLARRFAAGRIFVALIALGGAVPLVLVGYGSPSSTTFLLCNFLVQAGTASALGACGAASLALVRPQMRGTATAIFLLGATLIGLGFGPFVAGFVSEQTGALANGVKASLVAVVPGLVALAVVVRHYARSLARLG
ncbi:spinster family MFS transporter [Alteraurantiacibacter palmitatis]|uniref:Spinster family MFS transporter n=1 Tax=Alteraurantiacibacter palmitatis TaxID=2054628 RepID=A0ABV7E9F6_9SPHN